MIAKWISKTVNVLLMKGKAVAHLCKNTVEAFIYREVGKGYWFEDYDLENAIIVAEDFIEMDY
jgi:hypothetical protein